MMENNVSDLKTGGWVVGGINVIIRQISLDCYYNCQFELCSALISILEKPSKNKFGQSWDIVPTPPGPSPPSQAWEAYQKIKNIVVLYCIFKSVLNI